MKSVVVVGLGLIGGSLALVLRRQGFAVRAYDASAAHTELAREAGLEVFDSPRSAVDDCKPDAIVICTPISSIAPVFQEYRRQLTGAHTMFFHAGGLQSSENLSLPPGEADALIGTHPMAGSQHRGFAAAHADLFQGCTVLVERKATTEQLQMAMTLWTTAGAARIVVESAEAHDARMPVVSHLPQLAAIALAATISERGYNFSDLGTGGRDSTRLSASPFELWLDTLQRSRPDAVSLLARLQWNVSRVRDALATENWHLLEELWHEAAALHENAKESSDGT